MKTDDFLKQAALDIISILTTPPSSTTVTLEAGDEVKNALLKIAQSLHRVEPSPSPPSTPDTQVRENNPSTDIPNDLNSSKDDVQLPRVQSKERQWTKGAEPYKQTTYNLRPNIGLLRFY